MFEHDNKHIKVWMEWSPVIYQSLCIGRSYPGGNGFPCLFKLNVKIINDFMWMSFDASNEAQKSNIITIDSKSFDKKLIQLSL